MVNREKQAEVLRRTQALRKEQKKEQVLKAIQEIQKHSKPLTFKNIATVAGCSVSYLYKWDDIKALGVKVSKKLREEIANRNIEKVQLSIEAFKQYRDNHDVKSQEACFLSMICDEAEPNTDSKTKVNIKLSEKIVTAKEQSPKKLVDPKKLKKLSNLFNNKND